MFVITVTVLSALTIIAALFAFGVITIAASSIAKFLFLMFLSLLAIELILGRKHV